jgi:hypothetical protein
MRSVAADAAEALLRVVHAAYQGTLSTNGGHYDLRELVL